MISVHRASARFRTDLPGITSWHAFSSGAHYDPANLSFGPVIACDEHHLDPGAGFERHPHARVELISWVLDGSLRHVGTESGEHVVTAGRAQYQLAGAGIEHAELNASGTQPLHFVQLWLQTEEDVPDYDLCAPPLRTTTGSFQVLSAADDQVVAPSAATFGFVASGRWTVAGHELGAGDSFRARAESILVGGDGALLVVTVET